MVAPSAPPFLLKNKKGQALLCLVKRKRKRKERDRTQNCV